MARSGVLLLLVLLAAASLPGDAAAALQCEPPRRRVPAGGRPEVLATTVSLSCASRRPTEWCCQALVHSARVGGVGCLCRLVAERPLVATALNATDLLTLYGACAASPPSTSSHGGAAHLAAASVCDKGGARAPAVGGAEPSPSGGGLGSVRMGADDVPCFCRVAQLSSSFDVARIAGLYAACHGRVRGSLATMCPRLPNPNLV